MGGDGRARAAYGAWDSWDAGKPRRFGAVFVVCIFILGASGAGAGRGARARCPVAAFRSSLRSSWQRQASGAWRPQRAALERLQPPLSPPPAAPARALQSPLTRPCPPLGTAHRSRNCTPLAAQLQLQLPGTVPSPRRARPPTIGPVHAARAATPLPPRPAREPLNVTQPWRAAPPTGWRAHCTALRSSPAPPGLGPRV